MSSGFKENFERGGGDDEMDYDDSAFYYFGMAMLCIVLIPATYTQIISPVFFGEQSVNHELKNCKCKICQDKIRARAAVYRYAWFNNWFVGKFVVIVYLWYLCFQCGQIIKDVAPMKTFIPHEILGVDIDATLSKVKKAYRKLSREKHPDKNPDDPNAVTEFIAITKAYTIMTDETARSNFLKYGNPDGKGSMTVGIAMPTFLHQEEYQIQVLIVFFIVVVFVIPGFFYNRIKEGEKDIGGVDVNNRKTFSDLINENIQGKNIPVILAYSSEFSQMGIRDNAEFEILNKLKQRDEVKAVLPQQKKNNGRHALQVKSVVLLVGYMYDMLTEEDKANPGIAEDIDTILRAIPSYIDIMLTQTMMLSQLYKMGQSPKKITAKNVITIIQFSQNVLQGGWINKNHFQQLPHFDETASKRLKGRLNGKTLHQYCTMKKEERKALHELVFSDHPDQKQKFAEQELCIEGLPLVEIKMTAEVEGEDEIVVGDILTCKLTVQYLNLEKGEKSGYIHSKTYPYLKRDNWYLIITDENFQGLAAIEKLTVTDSTYVKEFKERIQRPGKIAFTAMLSNDSYKGLDMHAYVEVNVVAQAKNRQTFEYLKEDIKAIKEQNMLAAALDMEEEETDEDEDLDEDTELRLKMKALGLQKKQATAKVEVADAGEKEELDDQD